jgi:hypothetical protein
MQVGFDSDGSTYKDLDIVAAGYPGYGGMKKLYADWKCTSDRANMNTALVDCELVRGFSGGPIVAFTESDEPLLVGINSKGHGGKGDDVVTTNTSSEIVTFEKRNALQFKTRMVPVFYEALDNVRCD